MTLVHYTNSDRAFLFGSKEIFGGNVVQKSIFFFEVNYAHTHAHTQATMRGERGTGTQ